VKPSTTPPAGGLLHVPQLALCSRHLSLASNIEDSFRTTHKGIIVHASFINGEFPVMVCYFRSLKVNISLLCQPSTCDGPMDLNFCLPVKDLVGERVLLTPFDVSMVPHNTYAHCYQPDSLTWEYHPLALPPRRSFFRSLFISHLSRSICLQSDPRSLRFSSSTGVLVRKRNMAPRRSDSLRRFYTVQL
jgi:hypothetical protein